MGGITPRKAGNTGSRILHPEPAQGAGEALPPTVQTIEAHGIPSTAQVGDATVVRGPRHVTDQLVVIARHLEWTTLTGRSADMSRSLWWVQLSTHPTWLVMVVNEAGELIDGGIELSNDQMVALAGVAKHLLPSAAGLMLLTVTNQAGEVEAISTTDNPVKTLAAVERALLPRHPG
jgi:hypothetical protein